MECIFGQETGYTCTTRRNNSLSTSNRMFAFGFIALITLVIALAFAWLGAWLILPFAGIELLVLLLAFRHVERHAQDYERLTINGDMLRIEVGEVGRVQRLEFNRWWAQVVCERDGSRLALRSHGSREVVFGHHLTDEHRLAVAGASRVQLAQQVIRGSQQTCCRQRI
jgi:uncharacterized membrane protein